MYCGYALQEDGSEAEHPEGRHSGSQPTGTLYVCVWSLSLLAVQLTTPHLCVHPPCILKGVEWVDAINTPGKFKKAEVKKGGRIKYSAHRLQPYQPPLSLQNPTAVGKAYS